MKSQKQDSRLAAYNIKPGATGRPLKALNKPNKKAKATSYGTIASIKSSPTAKDNSEQKHVARQTRLIDSLTTMPEAYVVQKDSAGRPFIIKEVKLASIHGTPASNSTPELRKKARLIEHFFNGLVVPVIPAEVIRMINHERGLIYDTDGKNAFLFLLRQDGQWVKAITDGKDILPSLKSFAKVQANPDGTYSIEDEHTVVRFCWNGTSISYLKSRDSWQKLFRAATPQLGQFGKNPAEQFASLKLEDGSNLMRVRYDKQTGLPKSITYIDGEKWSTEDGVKWVISGPDGRTLADFPEAYLTIDQNGNVSHYVRSANGMLSCRVITPCGKCIKTPRRLDTEALMRGNT